MLESIAMKESESRYTPELEVETNYLFQSLSLSMLPSTKALFSRLPFKNGMNGLDLGCGAGETTFRLKNYVGNEGLIKGIDRSMFHIRTAIDVATQNNEDQVEFRCLTLDEWQENETYDFVYSRFFLNKYVHPQILLDRIYDRLKPGGFLIIEDLDFMKFQCFPTCLAFDRVMKLLLELKKIRGQIIHPGIGKRLQRLFEAASFQDERIEIVRPYFLRGKSKHLATITLEAIGSLLLKNELTTLNELASLERDLKAFEGKKYTSITLPSIYQYVGYKNHNELIVEPLNQTTNKINQL